MARASTPTITPLDTYAKIMGINPVHFNGGNDSGVPLVPTGEGCRDIWHQYPYQSRTRVSIEELAREMARVERAIMSKLRWHFTPQYIEDEEIEYPSFYRPEFVGTTGRALSGSMKSMPLQKELFITGGKRATTLIGDAVAVAYSDPDGDGWNELATISVATALTDVTELRVFFAGESAAPEWEVRPLLSKSLAGGTFTATIAAEMLLDPAKKDDWPGSQYDSGLDVTDAANFVTTLDIYRVYTDPEEQCTLYWSGRHDGITPTQTAKLLGRMPKYGIVSPIPADYASGAFTETTFENGFEPDYFVASYLSGQSYIRNGQYALRPELEQAVVYMTTARLEKPICQTCENVVAKEAEYKQDLVIAASRKSGEEETKFVRRDILACPFGTKRGEVEAWRIVSLLMEERVQHKFALL